MPAHIVSASSSPARAARLHRRQLLQAGCGLGLLLGLRPAVAEVPAAYKPLLVLPKATPEGQEFDLRLAQARARRERKRLYVMLVATDCAYCRRYEKFLAASTKDLVPRFERDWVVVELRGELSTPADRVLLRTDALRLPYAAFQRAIGDERARALVYPNVWVMDAEARPLMQMPAGAGTFETVPEQIEILNLES